jgi:hypothetical protein
MSKARPQVQEAEILPPADNETWIARPTPAASVPPPPHLCGRQVGVAVSQVSESRPFYAALGRLWGTHELWEPLIPM